jgi:hypothetical protein
MKLPRDTSSTARSARAISVQRIFRAWSFAPVALLLIVACTSAPTSDPVIDTNVDLGPGTRVLFIGNSYLYTADVPGIVQALADSAGGEKLAVATVAGPDMALVDHWTHGDARRRIQLGGWRWVVLQQGPSSTEINRDSLRLTTSWFAGESRAAGAVTALFSAWPAADRRGDFPRAIESYRLAAQDVQGAFLPVATAWLEAWERDASIQLYADGLHPSSAGAYLAALVVYGRLLNKSPRGLPAAVRLRGGAVFSVPTALAATLQDAAVDALAQPF